MDNYLDIVHLGKHDVKTRIAGEGNRFFPLLHLLGTIGSYLIVVMSVRRWNSVAERKRYDRYLQLSSLMIARQEELNRTSSDDSSSSSDSSIDGDVSSVPIILIKAAIDLKALLNRPIVDDTIDFNPNFIIYIRDLEESICLSEFRFRKDHLQEFADRLWPKMESVLEGSISGISCNNGYCCPYETGLLMVLYRLSRPRRLSPDIERFFLWRKSKISAVLQTFFCALYKVANRYLSNPSLLQHRFQYYANLINKKSDADAGGDLKVWGFIDGTLRRTCRPIIFQKLMYSGHKRCHGIKFQSVVTPDGLVALLYGPIPGSRHDSFMLNESKLLPKLRVLMPSGPHHQSPVFSLYGDPAYPQSQRLFGGFRHPQPGSPEAQWNTKMSKVRECVEWLYKEIIQQWAFLDFRSSMKIFLSPVGQYYTVGAFLTNIRCCCYGSQTSEYFDCHEHSGKLSMEEYLDLVAF